MALGRKKSIWTVQFSESVQDSLKKSLIDGKKVALANVATAIKLYLKEIYDHHQPAPHMPHPIDAQNKGLIELLNAAVNLDATRGGFYNIVNPFDSDTKNLIKALNSGLRDKMSVEWTCLSVPSDIRTIEDLSSPVIKSKADATLPIIREAAERDLFILVRICSEFILDDKAEYETRGLRHAMTLFPKMLWRKMFSAALNFRITQYESAYEAKDQPSSTATTLHGLNISPESALSTAATAHDLSISPILALSEERKAIKFPNQLPSVRLNMTTPTLRPDFVGEAVARDGISTATTPKPMVFK